MGVLFLKHPHFLKGSVYCAYCGERMIVSNGQILDPIKEDLSKINAAIRNKPERIEELVEIAKGHIHNYFGCGLYASNTTENIKSYTNDSNFFEPNSSSKVLLVEAAGFEPASEKLSFQLSTSVAFYLILSLAGAKKHAPVRDSPVVRDGVRGVLRARSPLNDALIRAAILPVRTAAALRQRLKQYYCRYLFYNVRLL